jgi:ATP-dependent Clp protease ATP-binding subunit ClpA
MNAEAGQVLKNAMNESQYLGHHSVGREHLLLGIASMPESVAAVVLEQSGVSLGTMRVSALRTLIRAGDIGTGAVRSRVAVSGEANRNRFDKFSERARKVLALSQEEAQRFQHNYIGTEHLLLGLVRGSEGVAAQVLANLDVQLDKVRSAVEYTIERGERIILGEIGLTPRAKKVIELAVDEARMLDQHYIGTEHLLLGLVREGEGIAAGVLDSMGVTLSRVREETLKVLQIEGERAKTYLEEAAAADAERTPRYSGPTVAFKPGPMSLGMFFRQYAFSDDCANAIALVGKEALSLQHHYVGPEHLLAALVAQEESAAARILLSFNVSHQQIYDVIQRKFHAGSSSLHVPLLSPMSPRSSQSSAQQSGQSRVVSTESAGQSVRPAWSSFIIEPLVLSYVCFGVDEAARLMHKEVDTSHLLLGLIREAEGVIPDILVALGVDVADLRTKIREELQAGK